MRTTFATSAVALVVLLGLFLFAPASETETPLMPVVQAEQEQPALAGTPKRSVDKSEFLDDDELFPAFLTQLSSVDFEERPLSDVCEFLAEQHKATLLLDVASLEGAGLTTDHPITLTLKNVSFEEVLNQMLRPLASIWRVEGDIVIVTTPDKPRLMARHYDISGLLKMGYTIESLTVGIHLAGGGEWATTRPDFGTLTTFDQTIIVRQKFETQRRIAQLLASLERPQTSELIGVCSHRNRLKSALKQAADCNFAETRLADAVKFLSTQHDIPILLELSALESAGVTTDTPITLTLSKKPLEQVLHRMLHGLHLTHVIQEGTIKITTIDEAKSNLQLVTYDVHDLVFIPGFGPVCGTGITDWIHLFRANCDEDKLQSLETVIVESTSGPWEDEPGIGIARTKTGVLVISQTEAVHGEIETLLSRLRTNANKLAADTRRQWGSTLVTKSYRLPKETATELMKCLPKLVAASSWKVPFNGETPSLQLVPVDPQLQVVKVRGPKPTPAPQAAPNKPAPSAPPVKNVVIRPQSNLVVRQSRENHREIQRFIRNLTGNQSLTGFDPNKPNVSGFSGGLD